MKPMMLRALLAIADNNARLYASDDALTKLNEVRDQLETVGHQALSRLKTLMKVVNGHTPEEIKEAQEYFDLDLLAECLRDGEPAPPTQVIK